MCGEKCHDEAGDVIMRQAWHLGDLVYRSSGRKGVVMRSDCIRLKKYCSYQSTGSIDACAAKVGAVHPLRPSELPQSFLRHRVYMPSDPPSLSSIYSSSYAGELAEFDVVASVRYPTVLVVTREAGGSGG